jgi:hypothetical protein
MSDLPHTPQAFPSTKPIDAWGGDDRGMDLRDYFAAHASEKDIQDIMNTYGANTREQARYVYADAMLKARGR